MRGLYAIIDVVSLQARSIDVLRFADAVLSARPAAIQLRDKRRHAHATLALLRELAPLARRRGVPLFANDRADLAALAGCDGLHLGQSDVPPQLAQKVAGALGRRLRLGLSVHNAEQLQTAAGAPLDYVAFGPVYPTHSKANPDPVLGIAGLAQLVDASAGRALPCVAIGGINPHNAAAVAELCSCAAVIGALLPAPGDTRPLEEAVSERAAQLQRALSGNAASDEVRP